MEGKTEKGQDERGAEGQDERGVEGTREEGQEERGAEGTRGRGKQRAAWASSAYLRAVAVVPLLGPPPRTPRGLRVRAGERALVQTSLLVAVVHSKTTSSSSSSAEVLLFLLVALALVAQVALAPGLPVVLRRHAAALGALRAATGGWRGARGAARRLERLWALAFRSTCVWGFSWVEMSVCLLCVRCYS